MAALTLAAAPCSNVIVLPTAAAAPPPKRRMRIRTKLAIIAAPGSNVVRFQPRPPPAPVAHGSDRVMLMLREADFRLTLAGTRPPRVDVRVIRSNLARMEGALGLPIGPRG